MAHDDGTSKKRYDSRETTKLSQKISCISSQENETGFFDRRPDKSLVDFEEIAESETCDSTD